MQIEIESVNVLAHLEGGDVACDTDSIISGHSLYRCLLESAIGMVFMIPHPFQYPFDQDAKILRYLQHPGEALVEVLRFFSGCIVQESFSAVVYVIPHSTNP